MDQTIRDISTTVHETTEAVRKIQARIEARKPTDDDVFPDLAFAVHDLVDAVDNLAEIMRRLPVTPNQ